MAGVKGKSGRRPGGGRRYRPVIVLWPGVDDRLIEFFEAVPPRRQGEAIKAALRSGGLEAGRVAADQLAAQETAMAAQERAEIENGLGSLGSQWDDL